MGNNIFEFSDKKHEKDLEAKHTGKHKETLEAPEDIPVPKDHINVELYKDFEGYTEKMDGDTKDALMEDQDFLKSVARTKRDFRELFKEYPSVKKMVADRGREGELVLQKVIMDLCFHNADVVLKRKAEGKEGTGKNPYLFGLSHYEKARILATRFKQYDAEKAAEAARRAEAERAAPVEESDVEKIAKQRKKAIRDRVKELTERDAGELGPDFKFELGGVTFTPESDGKFPNGLIMTDPGWGSVGPNHLFWVTGRYDDQTISFGFKVGDPTDLVEWNNVMEKSEDFGVSDKGSLEKWIEGKKVNIRKEGVRKKFNTVFGKDVTDMNEARFEIEGLTFTPRGGTGAMDVSPMWLSDGQYYRFDGSEYKGVKLEFAISVDPQNLFYVSNGPNFDPLGPDTLEECQAWVKREKARIDGEEAVKATDAADEPNAAEESEREMVEKVTEDDAKIGHRKADVLKKVRELAGDDKVELGAGFKLADISFTAVNGDGWLADDAAWLRDDYSYWFKGEYQGQFIAFGVHLAGGEFEVAEDLSRAGEKDGHAALQGDKVALDQWVNFVKHKIDAAKKAAEPKPPAEPVDTEPVVPAGPEIVALSDDQKDKIVVAKLDEVLTKDNGLDGIKIAKREIGVPSAAGKKEVKVTFDYKGQSFELMFDLEAVVDGTFVSIRATDTPFTSGDIADSEVARVLKGWLTGMKEKVDKSVEAADKPGNEMWRTDRIERLNRVDANDPEAGKKKINILESALQDDPQFSEARLLLFPLYREAKDVAKQLNIAKEYVDKVDASTLKVVYVDVMRDMADFFAEKNEKEYEIKVLKLALGISGIEDSDKNELGSRLARLERPVVVAPEPKPEPVSASEFDDADSERPTVLSAPASAEPAEDDVPRPDAGDIVEPPLITADDGRAAKSTIEGEPEAPALAPSLEDQAAIAEQLDKTFGEKVKVDDIAEEDFKAPMKELRTKFQPILFNGAGPGNTFERVPGKADGHVKLEDGKYRDTINIQLDGKPERAFVLNVDVYKNGDGKVVYEFKNGDTYITQARAGEYDEVHAAVGTVFDTLGQNAKKMDEAEVANARAKKFEEVKGKYNALFTPVFEKEGFSVRPPTLVMTDKSFVRYSIQYNIPDTKNLGEIFFDVSLNDENKTVIAVKGSNSITIGAAVADNTAEMTQLMERVTAFARAEKVKMGGEDVKNLDLSQATDVYTRKDVVVKKLQSGEIALVKGPEAFVVRQVPGLGGKVTPKFFGYRDGVSTGQEVRDNAIEADFSAAYHEYLEQEAQKTETREQTLDRKMHQLDSVFEELGLKPEFKPSTSEMGPHFILKKGEQVIVIQGVVAPESREIGFTLKEGSGSFKSCNLSYLKDRLREIFKSMKW